MVAAAVTLSSGRTATKKTLNKVGIGNRCDSGKIENFGMGSPYICGFLNEKIMKKNTKGHIIYISFKVRKTISFTMLIVVSASMRSRDLPLSLWSDDMSKIDASLSQSIT